MEIRHVESQMDLPYDRYLSPLSQFSYRKGDSSCTYISIEACLRFMMTDDIETCYMDRDRVRFEQLVESILVSGISLDLGLGQRSCDESIQSIDRFNDLIMLEHQYMAPVKHYGSFLREMERLARGESGRRRNYKVCCVFTKPPETICIAYVHSRSLPFQYMVFDSHSRGSLLSRFEREGILKPGGNIGPGGSGGDSSNGGDDSTVGSNLDSGYSNYGNYSNYSSYSNGHYSSSSKSSHHSDSSNSNKRENGAGFYFFKNLESIEKFLHAILPGLNIMDQSLFGGCNSYDTVAHCMFEANIIRLKNVNDDGSPKVHYYMPTELKTNKPTLLSSSTSSSSSSMPSSSSLSSSTSIQSVTQGKKASQQSRFMNFT